ncbi:MAG: transcription-repair coupling factor, partial [Candidatus Cloacimonadota bacterium]|nr:transcription-repair coupling factor [Candidatus Cloacimonadota bacterium]
EFARRGGIVDIFSPHMNKPVRIEFFGDEIDTMRIFSIDTQRSSGEFVDKYSIIPSREFSLHDIETSEQMWQRIHKDGFYEGIELDVSLLLTNTSTFLEYFDIKNTLLIWDEYQYIKSTIDEIFDEATSLFQKAKQENSIIPQPQDLFADQHNLNFKLKQFSNYYFSSHYFESAKFKNKIEAPVESQTNMHSNLEILEQDLRKKLKDNYRILIQSDNTSQSNRMRELLPEFSEKVDFTIGVLQQGFILKDAKLAVYTDHEIFSRYKRRRRQDHFSQKEALVDYESLKPGDYVVHIDHGIGIYEGLKKIYAEGSRIECLSLKYAEEDRIFIPTDRLNLVSKFVSEEGIVPTVHKLGSKRWEQTKRRAKKQIEIVAKDLVNLFAERKVKKGIAMDPDNQWQREMEDSFIYEDTPDQRRSVEEIKNDMESEIPMERLLCGDVGFGKTEVAIRASFKAVLSGFQVAVLVPTTLLAEQHYYVFRERLAQYPIKISMLSRFRSRTRLKKDLVQINEGQIDIAIGTHRLLSHDVQFKKLGLLIIDEEHRFGVKHKNKLRKLKTNVDTLYMSATPIPRTMNMALSKLKELSLIRTSPKARLPIRTVIVPYDKNIIKDAISREVARGGQVFFIHNRVETIDSIANKLQEMLPNIKFGIGHGQLPEKKLERIMLDFADHKFDVLVATTIIESGIDIPNVNTILINRADTFGLAQLYQIRGRVGRSNRRAYAYFIIPNSLTDIARKRLETLTEYESLGSGYQIAMRDMELRGAGTLLGTKQSGVINTIGFNYYNNLLKKAVEDLQQNRPIDLETEKTSQQEKQHISIESDYYFPENYIKDEKQRLQIYKRMLGLSTQEQFEDLKNELQDRFGKLTQQEKLTLAYFQLRAAAKKTKMKSVRIRDKILHLEFDEKNLPPREQIQKMLSSFTYPVSFDTVGNLQIAIDLSFMQADNEETLIKEAIKIVIHFVK